MRLRGSKAPLKIILRRRRMKTKISLFWLLVLQLSGSAPAKDYETVEFTAAHLGGMTVSFNIILPPHYSSPSSSERHYPVLYLLHGYTDHYPAWVSYTKVAEYATGYEEIIVMPEGDNSFYTNNHANPKLAWEDYLILDLIPYVDRYYRTVASRQGRAVAGLSMGGYGALKLGLKYPRLFAAVASLSGALASARPDWSQRRPDPKIKEVLQADFGPPDNPAHASNDPFELVKKIPRDEVPQLYLSVGEDDSLLEVNREFVRLLADLKIPYQYREIPGKHEWPLWDGEIQVVLAIQAPIISSVEAKPK